MKGRVQNLWRRWINQRIPRKDHQRFSQRNIFILPSGAGVVYGLLLLVMLITGINYQNSLIYLLTFLLGAVFVAAMHQTHRNLAGLELTFVQGGEGFPGETIVFRIRGRADGQDALGLSLQYDGVSIDQQHVMAEESTDILLPVKGVSRGYFRLDRVRVESRFPFGLLKAWSWMRPVTAGIVYPVPITAPDQQSTVRDEGDAAVAKTVDGNDHAEIRPWREGDMSQRVLWKRFARTGEMVIADWEGEQGSPYWLDYNAFQGVDQELRLSYLAHQVLERVKSGQLFGLNLPGHVIEPDLGRAHGNRCLKALALFGQVPPREEDQVVHGTRFSDHQASSGRAGVATSEGQSS